MSKLWLLMVLVISGYATGARADMDKGVVVNTCDPYGFVFKKKRVQESLKSLNLSTAFLNKNKVSFTWNTSWTGKMNCLGTADNAFFFSAIGDGPFYVLFTSSRNDSYDWIKFNVKVTGPEKTKIRGLPGVYSIARYQTTYVMTAELLKERPQDVEGRFVTVVNGRFNLPSVVMSGHGGADNGYGGITGNKYTYGDEVMGYVQQSTPASGWNTDHFIAFEMLSIQFEPNETTCDLPHDLTVLLNPISIDELQVKNTAGERAFSIPVECVNLKGGTQVTRNISAWLASNDLIDDGETGYVLVNDDSDALGVGIALRLPGGTKVAIANGIGSAPGSTELMRYSEGQEVSPLTSLRLVAYYQVYDRSVLSTGSVLGTAQLMFNYD
ncbi:fimbrial protein [Klebsiella sp. RHBSTW-00484]|uniref:fimbrial protein n=1 Tax=unclassified Klebsiella TaxID=2608929 RepID=UPI0015E4D4A4|nr:MULTISPECIES: fimbrial protein [unclassified Klebsiella]MBA7845657.1 fimbrial protein [Klebsiella sp. RHBSTW-00465]QLO38401.1 fimbrial protein [Klebsiella sp. RHBSTW-00484]QLT77921.1 fimbrial protein [Klebsiella sp. RHBSTW-00464]